MRAMTFNVLCAGRNEHQWCRRQPLVRDVIKTYMPDFFGIQEAHYGWMKYLAGQLKEFYGFVGVGKDDGKNGGEFSPVFYRKDKFTVLERLDFWLSETPENPGPGWDAAENRTCSGALFESIETGKKIAVFNTHLDHIGEVAQHKGAELILENLKKYDNIKTVLMGDFNVTPDSEIYKIFIDGGFCDARTVADESDDINSFHWFGGSSKMIDFVFVKNIKNVSKVKTATDRPEGRYPSDHYPVVADFE
ncbi:MAG: endonuclease/exonuclease/phosphatase family protein [Clostridia bacterium]|nr:endonuclease/exonuclease/phosphatase family protein [Clostridia bacterium]